MYDPPSKREIARSSTTETVNLVPFAKALKRGDDALTAAGIDRGGHGRLIRDRGRRKEISFGVAIGQKAAAEDALREADLGVPFSVWEGGHIQTQAS